MGRVLRKGLSPLIAFSISCFYLYTSYFGSLSPLEQRSILFFSLTSLTFIIYDIKGRKRKESSIPIYDFIPFFLLIAFGIYFFTGVQPEELIQRGVWGTTPVEDVIAWISIFLLLEATRRAVGLPLVIVALLFLSYAFLGPYLPGDLNHKGFTLDELSNFLFWTTEGVFGIPLGACATFVIVFIIFGVFLDKFGAGEFFIKLAYSLTGKIRGGPALTAVVSSGLMGMVSGSAVSNVVTTGAFTIPLMKRIGYDSTFAGAVEAVASTGGQFMPPVMGVAAFVMADMTDIPYWKIAIAAFLPAFLYFFSIGLMVYIEALKKGLKPVSSKDLPSLFKTFMEGWHFIFPVIVLIHYLMVLRYSPSKAGFYTVMTTLGVGVLNSLIRYRKLPLKKMLEGLVEGAMTMIPVTVASATAGIVIGIVSLTGLGVLFSSIIIGLAGGKLFLTLFLTMIACIILGMGVPTTAAYILTAILAVPALLKLNIPTLQAHLFVLYFAVLSFITPPVALSVYAASSIAGTNAMRTGFEAWRLGLAGFIVPYLFVYHPALTLKGSAIEILLTFVWALGCVIALGIILEGWLWNRLKLWERGLSGLLLFMALREITDIRYLYLLSAFAILSSRQILFKKPSQMDKIQET
ncbi:MAG: TRAP transporter permease [Synergistetes bacterium]|nr:TRAP transporter permease [Synergistota bacterium]